MTILMALDPGKTIGVAAASLDPYQPLLLLEIAMDSFDLVEQAIKQVAPSHVIMEDFVMYPYGSLVTTYSRPYVSELIGKIEMYCNKQQISLITQRASLRSIIGNATLKKFGFADGATSYRKMPHAKDAAKHLLVYLMRAHNDKFVEVLKHLETAQNNGRK